jgi:phospholipid/cholesterol/gamma-HCH transport system substrate-binding protein
MAELEIRPTAAARARVMGTIAAAAVIWGVLVFLLTGGGRNLFEDKTTITTFMSDATNLARKSDVRLSGIRIGAISGLEITPALDPPHAVRIEMRINSRFLRSIPEDSQTSIGEDTPIGYWFVSIAEGKSKIPLARDGTLQSEPVQQADAHVDLVQTLQSELRDVDNLLRQVSSTDTPIGRFVLGEKEYDDALARISSFDKAVHALVGPGSRAGQALFSDTLYNQFRDPLMGADNMLAAVGRGEGEAGRLFASDERYNETLRALRDLRVMLADASAGKGRLGLLLNDEAGYRKIRAMLAETNAMITSLNAGEGGIGRLVQNPQLYESLNGSLRDMQKLLNDLREHPAKYLRYKVY